MSEPAGKWTDLRALALEAGMEEAVPDLFYASPESLVEFAHAVLKACGLDVSPITLDAP